MYEANPMAFLVEQAGGAATNGRSASWTVPGKLHERVSVILGSKNEVERATAYHLSGDAGAVLAGALGFVERLVGALQRQLQRLARRRR
jgi:hypothetical protein